MGFFGIGKGGVWLSDGLDRCSVIIFQKEVFLLATAEQLVLHIEDKQLQYD